MEVREWKFCEKQLNLADFKNSKNTILTELFINLRIFYSPYYGIRLSRTPNQS